MTRFVAGALVALLLVPVCGARADTITRARITVDATDPAGVRVESALTVRAEGGDARAALDLYLSRAVDVRSADMGGQAIDARADDVPETLLRRWTLALPDAIPPGGTAVVTLDIRPGEAAGIRPGVLLPGSGWFPQLAPETDELPVHSTTFRLPAGQTGVAAGASSGDGGWTTTTGARPFAVWGEYEVVPAAVEPAFEIWRRPGRDSAVPGIERIARLASVAATGLGAEDEVPAWKLVDIGGGTVAGGRGTVFWDEEAAAAVEGASATLLERDLAAALATTFWTEHFRTVGAHGAWLSRSLTAYLGDVARIALDESDVRDATEAAVIKPRRDAYLAARAEDRALTGLALVSADAPFCLATRGALAAHALAESVGSRTRWMIILGEFRRQHAGAAVDLATFREFLQRSVSSRLEPVWALLETTGAPRFGITDHGPAKGHRKQRYRVEVENRGDLTGSVDVATYSANGHRMRTSRLTIPPAEKKSIAFDQPNHIARIALDPRGVTLQSALEDQTVELTPAEAPPAESYIPSFPIRTDAHVGHAVQSFSLELDGMSISNFDGYLAPYSTHHGPSGAALVGRGDVTITPGGEFAAGFAATVGSESLTFPGAEDLWIRFPLAAWERIEPQLGEKDAEHDRALFKRRQEIHSRMFRSYFAHEHQAQVPPPGSGVVVFSAGEGVRRGFVRRILLDGRTEMRLWDHRRQETIWEERH